jgi:dTDP-glucose pyrophosphorylase
LNGLAERVDLLLQPSADGGCIVFPSVHPRWSYVKTDPDGFLLEAAEKRPISKTAVAGVYCFSSGDLFLSAAMSAIRSGASTSGSYFISAALNQLILENKRLLAAPIEGDQYVTFYSPHKIADYESSVRAKRVDNRMGRVSRD